MSDDLISRSALLEKTIGVVVYDEGGWDCNVRAVPDYVVEKAPTVDAVEVVRCRYCKWVHYGMKGWCCTKHTGMVKITPDSFCSYGER